jgi:hypothetical protein
VSQEANKSFGKLKEEGKSLALVQDEEEVAKQLAYKTPAERKVAQAMIKFENAKTELEQAQMQLARTSHDPP